MDSNQESLDSEFVEEQPSYLGQLEATWSYFALALIGFEVAFFLSGFLPSVNERLMDVRIAIYAATSALGLYLLWYLKIVCNKVLNVTKVDLPIYVSIGLTGIYFASYFLKLGQSDVYQNILFSILGFLLTVSKIWLIVVLLRNPSTKSLYYLRLWAFAVILSMVGNMVVPLLIFVSMEFADHNQKMTQLVALLPDLTIVLLILTEPRLNVVKAKKIG